MQPMHRLILNAPDDRLVDHINRDKLDNRCSNLRLVSFKTNITNRGKQRNNSSGYTGVQYRKDRNKWFALIGNNGSYKRLGSFDNPAEAHKAYLKAKEERDRLCV